MFATQGLAVSFPPGEISQFRPPSSVFDVRELAGARLSIDLHNALAMLSFEFLRAGLPVKVIVRPEMYIHGEAKDWLHKQLGPIDTHISLSEGAVIRLIPGLTNFLFLYGLGFSEKQAAFTRLCRRAPDLFASVEGQINTAMVCYVPERGKIFPKPISLLPDPTIQVLSSGRYAPLKLSVTHDQRSRKNLGVADERMQSLASVDFAQYQELVYAPLTEAALSDEEFLQILGGAALRAQFSARRCVVIALPRRFSAAEIGEAPTTRVAVALQRTGLPLQTGVSENIFVCDGELTASQVGQVMGRRSLIANETFDYWRHSREFWSMFSDFTLTLSTGIRELEPQAWLWCDAFRPKAFPKLRCQLREDAMRRVLIF